MTFKPGYYTITNKESGNLRVFRVDGPEAMRNFCPGHTILNQMVPATSGTMKYKGVGFAFIHAAGINVWRAYRAADGFPKMVHQTYADMLWGLENDPQSPWHARYSIDFSLHCPAEIPADEAETGAGNGDNNA